MRTLRALVSVITHLWCVIAHGSLAAWGTLNTSTGVGTWKCVICDREWTTQDSGKQAETRRYIHGTKNA